MHSTTFIVAVTALLLCLFSVGLADGVDCSELPVFVETIPLGMNIPPIDPSLNQSLSIASGWEYMIYQAKRSIDIVAMYFVLSEGKDYPEDGGLEGYKVFVALMDAIDRGVNVTLTVGMPTLDNDMRDIETLRSRGAHIYPVYWSKMIGGGILHSKMMVVDNLHFYLGSANFDWRSLAQVKELGVILANCSVMARDAIKIVDTLKYISGPGRELPTIWPEYLQPTYNSQRPYRLKTSSGSVDMYISSGPSMVNPPNRTDDMDTIIQVISEATKFISLSVMDYSPIAFFKKNLFWPLIDNALRLQALKGREIKLLASWWDGSKDRMVPYLQSLEVLPNLDVKLLVVPPWVRPIPYTRVNHAKYIVTDKGYYITTSNWSPDYFLFSAGASVHIKLTSQWRHNRMDNIFLSDWNSSYSRPLFDLFPVQPSTPCPTCPSREKEAAVPFNSIVNNEYNFALFSDLQRGRIEFNFSGGRSSVSGIVATVFGCTGFLGRYVVNQLGRVGSQVVIPFRGEEHSFTHLKVMGDLGQIVPIRWDIRDEETIRRAMAGSNVVINMAGRVWKTRNFTMEDVHVAGARRIAKIAHEMKIDRFIHVSSLDVTNVDQTESEWVRTKAAGEEAVRAANPHATIIRPSTLWGLQDNFLNSRASMTRYWPMYPIINPDRKFTPVFVGDVATAIINTLKTTSTIGNTYELPGPRVVSEREISEWVHKTLLLEPTTFVPSDSFAWNLGYWLGQHRKPRFTVDSIMRKDDILPSGKLPSFPELNIPTEQLQGIDSELAKSYIMHFRVPSQQFEIFAGEEASDQVKLVESGRFPRIV